MATGKTIFRTLFGSLRSVLRAATIAVNGIVMFATIFSAYGGCFDPITVPIAALAAMILPLLLIAGLVMIAIDCFVNFRIAAMILAGWLVSLPEILIFSPMNLFDRSLTPAEEQRSFTLLTYNCQHLVIYPGAPVGETNGTIDYILAVDADVVNLQEVEFIDPKPHVNYTQAQADTLFNRYPYRYVDVHQQLTVLSKFPMEGIDITIPRRSFPCLVGAYTIDFHGTPVNLYNVHLKSIGLSSNDKTLFRQLPGKITPDRSELREEIRDVKEKLVSKLAQSFVTRDTEAHWLRQVIDSIGGNTIVAGDFNDIPGCHAQRVIMGDDLRDAYRENAFGPAITYHDNHFYFRIDHILYGGDIEAVDLVRDKPPYSDHYPLLTRILVNP